MKILTILALIIAMPIQASIVQLTFSNNWKYTFDDNTSVETLYSHGGAGVPGYTSHVEFSRIQGWSGSNFDSTRLVDSFMSRIIGRYDQEDNYKSDYRLTIKATFEPLPSGTDIPETVARISNTGTLDVNKSIMDNLFASLNQHNFYIANGRGDDDLSFTSTPVTLIKISAVPLPSAVWLMTTGIFGFLFGNILNKNDISLSKVIKS